MNSRVKESFLAFAAGGLIAFSSCSVKNDYVSESVRTVDEKDIYNLNIPFKMTVDYVTVTTIQD